jgi:hypothetical protein
MKGKLASAISTCLVVMICLGIVAAIAAFIFIPLRSNPAFTMGTELAQNDPAVIELFGSPVKFGLLVMGTTKGFPDGTGSASLSTSISGPKAKGSINIQATENPKDVWTLSAMYIDIDNKTVLYCSGDEGFQPK